MQEQNADKSPISKLKDQVEGLPQKSSNSKEFNEYERQVKRYRQRNKHANIHKNARKVG